ncbi:MAG: hypothetical protein KF753_17505 [Caldilineaceae bacterium]|nr:hypothetical protein [Caldilineaceae bacterium]
MQTQFIEALTAAAETDPRVRAAWLAGSFGKGIADRWSDVDAHLLIDPAHSDGFKAGVRDWLEALRPLVLYRLMFGGQMVNAMTDEGMRLDVWLHSGENAQVVEGQTQVLFAEESTLTWKPNPGTELSQAEAAAELERAIPEFWRCVAMLPVALGRDEKIIGAAGNFLILLLLTDVLSLASSIRKDRGVKALNGFLPPEYRQLAEGATFLPELTLEALARFQLRLARILQEHGPLICEQWNVEYPQSLEDAALAYVARELAAMGFSATLEELYRLPSE